jgi:phage transcriptional regulator, rinA family|nr:MAG TPA: Protein of unknown function (DUF1492) [Caudoviricetes sp.]
MNEKNILNKISEEMDVSKKEISNIVLNELEARGFIKNNYSTFKNVERILYEYPKLKASINEREKEISELKRYGIQEKSKSITGLSSNSMKKAKEDIIDDSIDNLKKHIFKTKVIIKHIESVINTLKNDPYFDIIHLKYFEGKTHEQIAEYIDKKNNKKETTSTSTIAANKNRLIESIRPLLLPNDLIGELLGY